MGSVVDEKFESEHPSFPISHRSRRIRSAKVIPFMSTSYTGEGWCHTQCLLADFRQSIFSCSTMSSANLAVPTVVDLFVLQMSFRE
jgi:hypothetical protein